MSKNDSAAEVLEEMADLLDLEPLTDQETREVQQRCYLRDPRLRARARRERGEI